MDSDWTGILIPLFFVLTVWKGIKYPFCFLFVFLLVLGRDIVRNVSKTLDQGLDGKVRVKGGWYFECEVGVVL